MMDLTIILVCTGFVMGFALGYLIDWSIRDDD